MKKIYFIGMLSLLVLSLLGCDNLCNKTEREITETFGNRTCTGKGVDKIEGYATCFSTIGSSYEGDVRGHKLHGKGKAVKKDGTIFEGYFNEGYFIAGKITYENGDAIRGLWSPSGLDNYGGLISKLELGKRFTKINGSIELGEFDNNDNLKYGMKEYNGTFYVGDFNYNIFDIYNTNYTYNGYGVNNNGCSKVLNGIPTDITRTVANTVYRNIGFKSALSQQGTVLNPYVVNLNVKKGY